MIVIEASVNDPEQTLAPHYGLRLEASAQIKYPHTRNILTLSAFQLRLFKDKKKGTFCVC